MRTTDEPLGKKSLHSKKENTEPCKRSWAGEEKGWDGRIREQGFRGMASMDPRSSKEPSQAGKKTAMGDLSRSSRETKVGGQQHQFGQGRQ